MVNIEIELVEYQGVHGHGYRSLVALVGGNAVTNIAGMGVVEFIELAVQDVIKKRITSNV